MQSTCRGRFGANIVESWMIERYERSGPDSGADIFMTDMTNKNGRGKQRLTGTIRFQLVHATPQGGNLENMLCA